MVGVIRRLIHLLPRMDLSQWRALFLREVGSGAPSLIGPRLLPTVRHCLCRWEHPLASVALAEWLRLCAVQGGYARRKEARLQEFRRFTLSLPPQLQEASLPQLLSFYVGHLALRPSIRSPATVQTYISEVASALGISRRARPVAQTLAGMNRLWFHQPRRAPPVEPQEAQQKVLELGSPQAQLLACIWIFGGLRQADVAHLLFEPISTTSQVVQGMSVLVIFLERRKGFMEGQGPRPEILLRGPPEQMRAVEQSLLRVKCCPVEARREWFADLIRWRQRHQIEAHSFRRGTAQWLSGRGASREQVAAVLGHAEAVKRWEVTQRYTEGRTWSERWEVARVLPPMWLPKSLMSGRL